jgi:hypothetical protein
VEKLKCFFDFLGCLVMRYGLEEYNFELLFLLYVRSHTEKNEKFNFFVFKEFILNGTMGIN